MRLWSIHPKYLDRIGLLAVWRESLLAKKVLEGKTKGFKYHPQLTCFKKHRNPIKAINNYLFEIYKEAKRRGYNFDRKKFKTVRLANKIPVTSGQIKFEFKHLLKKLKQRDPERYRKIKIIKTLEVHPIFHVTLGNKKEREKLQNRN